jgi:Ca2+-binding RTX toxin-like protein
MTLTFTLYEGTIMALVKGTGNNNYLTGGNTNDVLVGFGGDDTLNGGAGIDTAWYAGSLAEYRFGNNNGHLVVQDLVAGNGQDGKDSLTAIEQVQFNNSQLTVTGGEFRVNTYTSSDQYEPRITALADGGFVVSWTSLQDGIETGIPDYGVYAQRYDSTGTAQGAEFRVNTFTSDFQSTPSITALADGGFVVSWSSFQDGFEVGIIDYGVYAQRYDAAGTAQGAEFRVNTYTTNLQGWPSLTALANGGFVVSWTSDGQDGGGYGVYAQRYDAAGTAQGVEFRVNTITTSSQNQPSLTALADGGFVVSWTSNGQDGSGAGVYAQRYDAAGFALPGSEFRVNTTTTSDQYQPSITALADGGFVVGWTSVTQDGDGDGVYAQRYDAAGTAQGAEFRVNTTTADMQFLPSLTALADGGFVVSWTSDGQDGSHSGIYAQRYDASGSAQGEEFQVNTFTTSVQYQSSLTALADGGFVVSWESFEQDGSGYGVYAQRYDAAGNAVGPKLTGTDNAEVINLDAGAGLLVDGAGGNDTVNGATANDTMLGGAGNDLLNGGLGDDYLDGGIGADKLIGGKGHDTYVIDNLTDTVIELAGGGIDEVKTAIGYTLGANVENLTFTGTNNVNGNGNGVGNVLTGNTGNNLLDGKAGSDIISGGAGHDTLVGGLGNDFLQGDAGNDVFRFNTALSAVNNVDTIMDFNHGSDRIELSKAIFTSVGSLGGLNTDAFHTGIAVPDASSDPSDRIIYNSSTGDLYYDRDGNGLGAAVIFAHLDAGLALTAADFSVIA